MDWRDREIVPECLIHEMSVRSRLILKLLEDSVGHEETLEQGFVKMLHKVPLLFWSQGTMVKNAHVSNHKPGNRVQMALAHFKFFPGWQEKVNDALLSEQYVNKSQKYRPLDLAAKSLGDWPLAGHGGTRRRGR